ncbi:MAG: hypothetical protein WCP79_14405 [Bacillota bacterium]
MNTKKQINLESVNGGTPCQMTNESALPDVKIVEAAQFIEEPLVSTPTDVAIRIPRKGKRRLVMPQ